MSLVIYGFSINLEISEGSTSRKRDNLYNLSSEVIFDFKAIGIAIGIVFLNEQSKRFKLFQVEDLLFTF